MFNIENFWEKASNCLNGDIFWGTSVQNDKALIYNDNIENKKKRKILRGSISVEREAFERGGL